MRNNLWVIYKGKEYSASLCQDGSIILRSGEESDINYGFTKYNGVNKSIKCFKYVLKSEVEEIYRKNIKAQYLGYEFLVIDEVESKILICTINGDYNIWLKLGMECVDKGVYQKWIDKNEAVVKIEKEKLN